MRILSALGVLAGGFLLSPPTAVVTLVWLGARLHPVATIVVLAAALAWRADHD